MAFWKSPSRERPASFPGRKALISAILLLPVFFLLHNNNELFGFIPVSYLLTFGAYIYGLTIIAFLLLLVVTRTRRLSFITLFFCLLISLFWGAFHDFIKTVTDNSAVSKYSIVMPVITFLLIICIRYLFKKPLALQRFSKYVNTVLIILCCLEIFNMYSHYRQFKKDNNLVYPERPICNSFAPCHRTDSSKPDIYFIIFDEYAHNRTLHDIWKYDNSDITQWLASKGFYIPDSSKANFSYTPYSMGTIFNMDYIKVRRRNFNDLFKYTLKSVKSMSDNETFCLLRKEHYDIHFIGPFENSFETLPVDLEFDDYPERKLYRHTFPERLKRDLAWHFISPKVHIENEPVHSMVQRDKDYDLIFNKIKSTVDSSTKRPPKFVYGHLMITHKPHIYDSVGNVYTYGRLNRKWDPLLDYINQVKEANRKIRDLVHHILTHNKKNTIIIVMGDHGFRRLPIEQSRYYLPNFSAFYFPNRDYPSSLANISAVNTFRIVFNQYFCQNLKLLKDSSIIVKY